MAFDQTVKPTEGIKADLKVSPYSEYQIRIRQCFADAYRFFDEHKCARTADDWNTIAESLSKYTDPFTAELVSASLKELRRESVLAANLGSGLNATLE